MQARTLQLGRQLMGETRAAERAHGRIERVAESLGIPDSSTQIATMLLKQGQQQSDFAGRKADDVGAAALLIACKQNTLPVTIHDVAETWNAVTDDSFEPVGSKGIRRQVDFLKDATGVTPPPTQPGPLVDRYAEELSLDEQTATGAHQILKDVMATEPSVITGGQSPSGMAASAIYLSARINGVRMDFTQNDIADVADVSPLTIRNRYKDLIEALGGKETLRDNARYIDGNDTSLDAPQTSQDTDGDGVEAESDIVEVDGEATDTAEEDDNSDAPEPTDQSCTQTDEPDSGDANDTCSENQVTLDASRLLAVRRAIHSDESETVEEAIVEASRETLKAALDGTALPEPLDKPTPVSVDVMLPTQITRLVDAEVADPATALTDRDDFVDAAVAAHFDVDPADSEPSEVALPAELVDTVEEYLTAHPSIETVDELIVHTLDSEANDG